MSSPFKKKLVTVNEARRFVFDCFRAAHTSVENATAMADILVYSDTTGLVNNGMNRLDVYINDLLSENTDGCSYPKIIKESPATAWVDGCNGLGAVVGNYCMDLAIKKAKGMGVGWVVVKNSNHFGTASWYVKLALKERMIGISSTNTSCLMVPTLSKEPALGTNPISFGAPGVDDEFLLDIATSTVALGKIEMKVRRNEPIPNGWAQDTEGNMTNDAAVANQAGCLLPLGGTEIGSSYKGYALSGMLEILTGILAGANYSTLIPRWLRDTKRDANLGHLFIAVNPSCFAPGFEERVTDFNKRLRNCQRVDPARPVLVPGDKEEASKKAVEEAGGIMYVEDQLKSCAELAKKLNVKPMSFVSSKRK